MFFTFFRNPQSDRSWVRAALVSEEQLLFGFLMVSTSCSTNTLHTTDVGCRTAPYAVEDDSLRCKCIHYAFLRQQLTKEEKDLGSHLPREIAGIAPARVSRAVERRYSVGGAVASCNGAGGFRAALERQPRQVVVSTLPPARATLVAASSEGRRAIGFEQSAEYCGVIDDRLQQASLMSPPELPPVPDQLSICGD